MYIEVYKSNDNMYVAACPDLELFSKGRTRQEAVDNLEERIVSYLKFAEASAEALEDIKSTSRYYSCNYPQRH